MNITTAPARASDLSTVRAVFGPTMMNYMKLEIDDVIGIVMFIER
jgi:hypothetical protein